MPQDPCKWVKLHGHVASQQAAAHLTLLSMPQIEKQKALKEAIWPAAKEATVRFELKVPRKTPVGNILLAGFCIWMATQALRA